MRVTQVCKATNVSLKLPLKAQNKGYFLILSAPSGPFSCIIWDTVFWNGVCKMDVKEMQPAAVVERCVGDFSEVVRFY